MQVGRVSWAGQTFSLTRCGDSQGKKHRSRRTKEERRKMVESFIRRHRTSNNGNFPSLNLTHKEVGGSFYTVREIVREIIQENRVLCPGNLNSQQFVLNDFKEEVLEPFSENSCNLPLITVDPSSMHRRKEASDSNENENTNALPTVSLIFSDQHISNSGKEDFALSSNEGSALHQEHCLKKACGHVDSANEKSKEELVERTGQRQNLFPTLNDEESLLEAERDEEEIHAKYEVGNHVGLNDLSVVNPTVGASAAEVNRNYLLADDVKVRFSSEEGENSRRVGFVFDKPENQSSPSHDEVSSPSNAEIYYSSQSRDSIICVSAHALLESAGVSDVSEAQVDALSSAKGSTMQVDSEPTVDSVEGLSSSLVDQKNAKSTEVPTSNDTWYPNSCERIKDEPSVSPNGLHKGMAASISNLASEEAGYKDCSSSSGTGRQPAFGGTNRESSEAEQKKHSEANPLWVIIKGFAAALIKFWIE